MTRLLAAPRAASLAGTRIPLEITTSPVAVFDDGLRRIAPDEPPPPLNSEPEPLIEPVKVKGAVPDVAVNVPPPGPRMTGRLIVRPFGLFVPKRVLGVYVSPSTAPEFIVIEPPAAPSCASESNTTLPPLMNMPPEMLLVPDRITSDVPDL